MQLARAEELLTHTDLPLGAIAARRVSSRSGHCTVRPTGLEIGLAESQAPVIGGGAEARLYRGGALDYLLRSNGGLRVFTPWALKGRGRNPRKLRNARKSGCFLEGRRVGCS